MKLSDGREFRKECLYVKGHPANPFTTEEFIAKFKLCVPYSAIPLAQQTVNDMIHAILHFEEIDDAAGALLDPLAPPSR